MNKLILITLLFYVNAANAAWTRLVCTKPDDKFSISVEFEEGLKLVRVNDGVPVFSTIGPSSITFNVKFPDSEYMHQINRLNGVMSIQRVDTGVWLTAYQCTTARQQF